MAWSHSLEVKAELVRLPLSSAPECWAELAGIWRLAGGSGGCHLSSAVVARRAYSLARELDLGPVIQMKRAGARPVLHLAQGLDRLLQEDGRRHTRAYVRGTFLARGYVADPDRSYHIEILTQNLEEARHVQMLLHRLHVDAGLSVRRRGALVYLKNQDQVGQFLAHLGAHDARLELESLLVMKSMRNQVNRLVNSETANLRRTVESGVSQTGLLEELRAGPLWARLPEEMKALALLRIRHPDWSLRELGRALNPPLSKSGTAHRLRRLMARAGEHYDAGGRLT